MLRNVVEDYLEAVSEFDFFLLFPGILEQKGYSSIHFTHGTNEFGKDFIAQRDNTQFIFQLKAGSVDTSEFRNSIQNQLIQAITNSITHPGANRDLPRQLVLVITGTLNSITQTAIHALNDFIVDKLHERSLLVWDRETLLEVLYRDNFAQYFEVYFKPAQVQHFLVSYTTFMKGDLSTFEIESATKNWLTAEKLGLGHFRPFIETSLFDRGLMAQNQFYSSLILQLCLYRTVVIAEPRPEFLEVVRFEIQRRLDLIQKEYVTCLATNGRLAESSRGSTPLFDYATTCLRTAEALALSVLTDHNIEQSARLLITIISKEKGSTYVIGDNYAITVYLILLALEKLGKRQEAKAYLRAVTVWLCDRYSEYGIAPVGATEEEEVKLILSEHLTGFGCKVNKTSFLATILLFIAAKIEDRELLNDIRNDLASCDVILKHFHVNDDTSVWTYDSALILESFDTDYGSATEVTLPKHVIFDQKNSTITVQKEALLYSIVLLRERCFYSNYDSFVVGATP